MAQRLETEARSQRVDRWEVVIGQARQRRIQDAISRTPDWATGWLQSRAVRRRVLGRKYGRKRRVLAPRQAGRFRHRRPTLEVRIDDQSVREHLVDRNAQIFDLDL